MRYQVMLVLEVWDVMSLQGVGAARAGEGGRKPFPFPKPYVMGSGPFIVSIELDRPRTFRLECWDSDHGVSVCREEFPTIEGAFSTMCEWLHWWHEVGQIGEVYRDAH